MIDPQILAMIEAELARARAKFPGWPTDPVHAAAILAEEAGETVQAALGYTYEDGSAWQVQAEAVQAAAMAIRLLENMSEYRRRRAPGVAVWTDAGAVFCETNTRDQEVPE